jgi:hypothetical protein
MLHRDLGELVEDYTTLLEAWQMRSNPTVKLTVVFVYVSVVHYKVHDINQHF